VRSLIALSTVLLASLLPSFGCGGASYTGGVFTDGNVSFAVTPPAAGWSALRVEEHNDLAWFSEDLSAVIQVNGSCDPRLDLPLVALENHLLIGFTDRERLEQLSRSFDAREALDSHLRAKLDGVVRELRFVILKKDECVYDFALVAPPGASFERANQDFSTLLESFESR